MTLALICFVALGLFAAMALVVMMVVGERSATESRLAALQAQYDPDVATAEVADTFGPQDAFAVITRPLAPFRDWLRSRDQELNYRLTLAGFRNPGAADTFLSFKLLCPIVGVGLATFFWETITSFLLPCCWLSEDFLLRISFCSGQSVSEN